MAGNEIESVASNKKESRREPERERERYWKNEGFSLMVVRKWELEIQILIVTRKPRFPLF